MPSLVTLPFIQCHHTLGLAALEGVTKSVYSLSSVDFTVCEKAAAEANKAAEIAIIIFIKQVG